MKAGLLTLAVLAATASAQVRREVRGRHNHLHAHPKRDNVVYETLVQYVTATAPHAIVYVDGNGKPISTAYNGSPAAASTNQVAPAAYTPPVAPVAPVAPVKSSSLKKKPAAYTPPPAPVVPKPQPQPTSSAAPSYGGGSGSTSGRGVSYAPYNADSTCKTQDQINSDFAGMDGYGMIRIYGTDCGQVPYVMAAAKAKGMKIFAGIFDIANVAGEAATLIAAAQGDWSMIDTISIGNELVNQGTPAATVVAAINVARGLLKAAGYNGNVVTVDTFVAMIANPSLCEASDYAAANAHAFFDGNVEASGAGAFVKDQAKRVSDACGGKRVVITETGWPWQGETNGAAVPSRANQQLAIDSLKSNFSEDIYLFSAYDDMWKKNFEGSFGCEQFWGMIQ